MGMIGLLLSGDPIESHPAFARYPNPAIIGHRGAPGHAPENTIAGFERALELGADVLEMDLWMTRDGEIVVLHDATVDRTTDGSGPIYELTWEEVQKLDAGAYFMTGPFEFPYAEQGIGVPSLREVFERFPEAPMLLEIKPNSEELARAVVRLIREFDRVENTVLGSFHTRATEAVREAGPEIATGASQRESTRFFWMSLARLTGLHTPQYEALILPERTRRLHVTSPPLRRAADERGLKLFVWTVNQPSQIRRLLQQGVDGIVTDYPDRVLEAAEARELR